MYCPSGLEGLYTYHITILVGGRAYLEKTYLTNTITAGYNSEDEPFSPVSSFTLTYRFEVFKGIVSIASRETTIAVSGGS